MSKKYNWIDNEIIVDFPLPTFLQNVINDLEAMDKNQDEAYFEWCGYLENCTKEFVLDGIITEEQRDRLCERYHGD